MQNLTVHVGTDGRLAVARPVPGWAGPGRDPGEPPAPDGTEIVPIEFLLDPGVAAELQQTAATAGALRVGARANRGRDRTFRPGTAAAGDVSAVGPASPQQLTLQVDAAPASMVAAEVTAERGPDWAIGNVAGLVASVSPEAGRIDRAIFERVWTYLHTEALEALAEMGKAPDGRAEAISKHAAQIAVCLMSRFDYYRTPDTLGRPHGGSDQLVTANYPFLAHSSSGWGSSGGRGLAMRKGLKEALDLAAARSGGGMLFFASYEKVEELGRDQPGWLIAQMGDMADAAKAVSFNTKVDSGQLKILRAFFRDA